MRAKKLFFAASFLIASHFYAGVSRAGTILWTGAGDGVSWGHANNLSNSIPPGVADDAVIAGVGSNVTVIISSSVTIQSVQCSASLNVSAGSLNLSRGASQVSGSFTIAPDLSLNVSGSNTMFAANGPTVINSANFTVSGGASVSLPGVQNYVKDCNSPNWTVTGTNSVLSLPGLTNLTGNVCNFPTIQATAGGQILASNLANITVGPLTILVNGGGSLINLSGLRNASGAGGYFLSFVAQSGGTISAPQMTGGPLVSVTLNPGGVIPTAQIQQLGGIALNGVTANFDSLTKLGGQTTISGVTLNFPALTNCDDGNFIVNGGAVVTLPAVQSYSKDCNSPNWTVTGTNSVLSLPGLTNLTGNVCNYPTIQATAGGQILATNLANITVGPLTILADGGGSLVNLSGLQSAAGAGGYLLSFAAQNGGTVLVPQMTGGPLVGVTLNPGGVMPTAQIQQLGGLAINGVTANFNGLTKLGGQTTISGVTLNFPALTNCDYGNFTVNGGAVVTLPAVQSYSKDCNSPNWTVSGTNSVLSLPGLTNLTGNVCNYPTIQATAGGQILATNLASITVGPLTILADGGGSLINLSGLRNTAGAGGYLLSFVAQNGGTVWVPQMTGGPLVGVTINPGGIMPVGQLQQLGGLTLNGVTASFPALTTASGSLTASGVMLNFPALTNFNGGGFNLSSGSVVTMPALQNMALGCNANWTVTGSNTVLQLPGLTNLSASFSFCSETIQATAGGQIAATNLASMAVSISYGGLSVLADGTNSLIDFRSLQSCTGNLAVTFQASNGGTLWVPALTSAPAVSVVLFANSVLPMAQLQQVGSVTLNRATASFPALGTVSGSITVSGVPASFPALTNFNGAGFNISAGAVVSLPVLQNEALGCNANWLVSGSNSVLQLPALTNLNASFSFCSEALQATAGGTIAATNLATMTVNVSYGGLQVLADGTNSLIDFRSLQTCTGNLAATFQASNGGTLLVPALTSAPAVSAVLYPNSVLPVGQLQLVGSVTLNGVTANFPTLNMVSGSITVSGVTVSFPALTNFNGGGLSINGGAVVSLPVLQNEALGCNANWLVSGSNSVLQLPALTNLSASFSFCSEAVQATAGGQIAATNLTSMAVSISYGGLQVLADGTNSLIDFRSLQSCAGNLAATFQASNGGTLWVPLLTNAPAVSVLLYPNAIFPVAQLQQAGAVTLNSVTASFPVLSTVSGSITASNVTVSFPALANFNGAGINLSGGAVVSLPALQNEALGCNANWVVSGPNTVLTLLGLTNLTASFSFCNETVEALAGGQINASKLASMSVSTSYGGLLVLADGVNSVIDLSRLVNYQPSAFTLTATNGGVILLPQFADLSVTGVSVPAAAVIGQPVSFVFTITNNNSVPAVGPWQNQFILTTNLSSTNVQVIGMALFTNSIAGHGSTTLTQSVILPASSAGSYYLGVTANSDAELPEQTRTNNTAFSAALTVISGADLALTQLGVPASAQLGQSIVLTFAVTNLGSAIAGAAWNDQLYLGSSPGSIAGATLLATLPGSSPLAPGAGYARSESITLPLSSSSSPGTYYILGLVDGANAQIETSKANNLLSKSIALTLPPLPDLAVPQVSAPGNAIAGQPVNLSWSVTNQGGLNITNGAWTEAVGITNAGGVTSLLAAFRYTNSLDVGGFLTRIQTVTLPGDTSGGPVNFFVTVNSLDDIIESNATNNTTFATNPTVIPFALSLVVPVTNVVENTSTPNLSCLLSRNGNLAVSALISLASTDTNHLLVPANVTIPAGVATAPFTATVLDDGVPGPNALVTLTANAIGYLDATSMVTVVNTDVPGLALTFALPQITEGQSVTATVTRSMTNSQPVVVTLASSSFTALTLPGAVTIPANSNSVTFTVLAVQNTVIAPTQTYTVSAAAGGYAGASASLSVLNNNAPSLSLSLDRTNINEADGAFAVIATLSRQPVTAQPVTVALVSTNPGAALVPAQVTFPALEGSAYFYVAAVNDTNVTGPKVTLISAQTLDVQGNLVGSPATELLVVQDNNGPALRVTIANKVLPKGTNATTTAVVWTATPPASDLVVTLTSSDTNEATAPLTVTMPAGQTNTTFTIVSINDGIPFTSATVSITASATNYASGSDVLTVTDSGLPDLVIASISAPGAAFTDQPLTIGFRLLNQGLGTLTNGVSQNVYFTTNPATGTYLLAGVTYFSGSLAAGQYVDESIVLSGNALPPPGTYWVVVAADANNDAAELNEVNNNAVSSSPIVVSPEYTAVVQAGLTNVLMGTPVPLTGSATLIAGGPAAHRPVNLLVTLRGLQRILSVSTDTNGNFSTVFTPLPSEAGIYTVSAVSPGVASAPPQAQFNILGMSLNPASVSASVIAGGSASGLVTLQNLTAVPLTGVTAALNGLAANLTAGATLNTNYLAGQGALTLSYNLTATDASILQSSFTIHLATVEGVVLDLPVAVTVNPLQPRLVTTPAQLSAAMLAGSQTLVQFSVANLGGAASGPLTVSVPAVPWLSVASVNPLPSLAPGQSNLVTLVLTPALNLALGPYNGNLAVNGSGAGVQIPFTFDAVSDAHGALVIQSVDEFTFFAAGSPPLTNANLTLTDPFTGAVVASGVTDSNGQFLAPSLLAGTYALAMTAAQHASFNGSAVVTAGRTNSIQAFLSLQTVSYTWTVVPTQIQDQTTITVDTTFQTDVPAPVVVPSPASLDLSPLTQPGQFMDVPLTLANYGLIAVENVAISISSNPLYQFDLVTQNIGTLPAHGTVTIPMRITRLAGPGPGAQPPAPPPAASCGIIFGIGYFYPCGPFGVSAGVRIPVLNVAGGCGGPIGGGTFALVGCNGCAGGVSFTPPSYSPPTVCSCDSIPKLCIKGDAGLKLDGLASKLTASLTKLLPNFTVKSVEIKVSVSGELCTCCESNQVSAEGNAKGGVDVKVVLTAGPSFAGSLSFQAAAPWTSVSASVDALLGVEVTLSGSLSGQLVKKCLQDPDACINGSLGLTLFSGAKITGTVSATDSTSGIAYSGSVSGTLGLEGSATASLSGCLSSGLKLSVCGKISALANLSGKLSGKSGGVNVSADITLSADQVIAQAGCGPSAVSGPPPPDPPPPGPIVTDILPEDVLQSQANVLTALGVDSAPKSGVCAQIKLQLNQSAVLTRDAFQATFQLVNQGAFFLTNIAVHLAVQNQAGLDVSSLFGLEPPALTGGLTAVDGTGVLAISTTGAAQWTLIPSLDAAPQVPTNYLVSGTFTYTENGTVVTLPLAPEPIAVQPSPQLYLKYFLQRDVYGDDPFTPEIEPSVPFPLAVMVQNTGYGAAENFQITSAQPKIIDNQKGLLINFNIIGTEVNRQPVSPSLTVNFGEIAPGTVKIGEWLLTSSLEGLFTDYSATYQHVDPLGNPRLSLIQGVEIHEITHAVQADGAWDDGQPDFLVIDPLDPHSLPNLLYLSDATVQPVSVVQSGAISGPVTTGNLQVQFTANFPAGFSYVLVPDPANGQFPLQSVLYTNGAGFLTNNFWLTDRTFIGQGHPPLLQTNLHLFAYHTNAGPDTFTLVYGTPMTVTQTNPPVSSVFALPAQSPPAFGVVWSGASYAGGAPIAYYDIFASDNGGPFTDWQSQTTSTGAIYNGVPGHTYAFYSVATDTAGHRQATPLQAQTQTTVSLNNTPPTISVVSNVILTAGQTLSLNITASDANPLATLAFSLGPGAPAGVVVNPANGRITWATSPAFAGTTNQISVIVTDNGQPPLSATGTVTVVLLQIVNPPVLAPIPNYAIDEASSLTVTNTATDNNLPPRPLTFSLGAGAPTNAVIGSVSGVFQWRPNAAQSPSTNIIAVMVSDNGIPPLSATQQFTVIVSAVSFEFLLRFGSTNLLVGGTNSVPVMLDTQLPLTNLTAVLRASTDRLTNLTLSPVSAETITTLFQPLGSNQYAISFTLNPSLRPGNPSTLAQLQFVASPQPHSAIVPLLVSPPVGIQSDGTIAAKPGAANGRVIIVSADPVLDAWLGTNETRMLTLYGNPGANYQLAYTTNIAGTNWIQTWRLPLTNLFQTFFENTLLPQVFYRAWEY